MTSADEEATPPGPEGSGDGLGDLRPEPAGEAGPIDNQPADEARPIDSQPAAEAQPVGPEGPEATAGAAGLWPFDDTGAVLPPPTAPGGTGFADAGPAPARVPKQRGAFADWLLAKFSSLRHPEAIVTFFAVTATVVFVFVQFDPSYLFLHTTITGGDTGAHVLLPWVAMEQLLPHLRLTGWTSSNWDGFPAVTFYFPLPIYSIVAVAKVFGSYDVAFKLLTAAPMILQPVAAWLMGRLFRAPFPIPAVMAVATVPYMFGSEYSIYGGNIFSTLAGEFAFGWSLWFALVFLGLVARGLQTGRYRAWAAVMFACTFMSHIDPTMFAAGGAVVIIVLYALRNRDWRGALWWSVPTVAVGGFLAAWWALAFYERFPYVTNMGYTRNTDYIAGLFPQSNPNDTWLLVMAGAGCVLSLARRRRVGEFFVIAAVLSALAFRFMPQSILWNNRVLPFWFLSLYILAGLALVELYYILVERTALFSVTLRAALLPAPLLIMVAAGIWVGGPLRVLPGEHQNKAGQEEFLGIPENSTSQVPGWISWNYTGYQYNCNVSLPSCKSGDVKSGWPQYQEIVTQLEDASKKYGCGSVMWEYSSMMNIYGTTDALTILPYWTNGCIGSMEGLYYESSATTPFHFINQSELSLSPSDPMVGIPYSSGPNVQLGVQHLQMLGVKYYMAINTEVQTQAAADSSLQLISRFGPFTINYGTTAPSGTQTQYWDLYLVKDAPRVHPLANQPVVMEGLDNSTQPKYLQVMTGTTSSTGATNASQCASPGWYLDPSAWDVYIAANGPSNWKKVGYCDDTDLPVTPEPKTTVSGIVEKNASISFNVTRTGVPVVVTISYFPNWQVSGAEGVYRVSPNLMVVIPTSHHVRLWYGYTPVDYEGYGLSLLALVGLIALMRRPRAPVLAVRRAGLARDGGLGLADIPLVRFLRDRQSNAGPGQPPDESPGFGDGPYHAGANGAQADNGDGDGDHGWPSVERPWPEPEVVDEGLRTAAPTAQQLAWAHVSPWSGPAEASPAEAGPAEAGPAEAGPAEAGQAVLPAEATEAQAGPAKGAPAEAGPAEDADVEPPADGA